MYPSQRRPCDRAWCCPRAGGDPAWTCRSTQNVLPSPPHGPGSIDRVESASRLSRKKGHDGGSQGGRRRSGLRRLDTRIAASRDRLATFLQSLKKIVRSLDLADARFAIVVASLSLSELDAGDIRCDAGNGAGLFQSAGPTIDLIRRASGRRRNVGGTHGRHTAHGRVRGTQVTARTLRTVLGTGILIRRHTALSQTGRLGGTAGRDGPRLVRWHSRRQRAGPGQRRNVQAGMRTGMGDRSGLMIATLKTSRRRDFQNRNAAVGTETRLRQIGAVGTPRCGKSRRSL